MAEMTGNRLLAEMLKAYGVTHVFFVPGIIRPALAEMEEMGIRRVVTHHEVAAAYMADGYARASFKPGVCLAQAVGAANLAAGLREAWMYGAPVIAISGGTDPDTRYRHVYQEIEDFPMFGSVTKANYQVERGHRLPDMLRLAFRTATTGRPAPVHLRLPVSGAEGSELTDVQDFEAIIEERYSQVPAFRPEPDMGLVQEAAKLLSAAQRPAIVAGGGITNSQAESELIRLAEKLQIPVAYNLNAKGCIPENHYLAMGTPGRYGRVQVNQALAEADLVFFVGSRAGSLTTNSWKFPPQSTPIIQVDIDPTEVGRNYPVKVGIVGDCKLTLSRLIEVVEPVPTRPAWQARTRELVEAWRADEFTPYANSDATPIRPERICKEISDALPENAIMMACTGHSAIWTGTMLELKKQGQRFIRCCGTLGWAVPASIGVKAAVGDSPVVVFTGDGGMMYHLAELETAARQGLNVIWVVNNNAALAQTKRGLDAAYTGKAWGKADEMWVFEAVNFAKAAEVLGCVGIRVEKPEELRPALDRALAANRPVVVDVLSDRMALPKWG